MQIFACRDESSFNLNLTSQVANQPANNDRHMAKQILPHISDIRIRWLLPEAKSLSIDS